MIMMMMLVAERKVKMKQRSAEALQSLRLRRWGRSAFLEWSPPPSESSECIDATLAPMRKKLIRG